MNKKIIISISAALVLSSMAAFAESTIYTDSIGRIHFLGRDAANNINKGTNYTNSSEQDLTRKLYQEAESKSEYDTTYEQHPLKNYENTFPDSRFSTYKKWMPKSEADAEKSNVPAKTVVQTSKGATDYTGGSQYGSTILDNPYVEQNTVIKNKKTTKKHWWNKNKD